MHILLYPMISPVYLHCTAEVSNWRIEELQSIEGAAVKPVCNQLEVRNWWFSPEATWNHHGDLMGFYGDLMGFYGDLMGY